MEVNSLSLMEVNSLRSWTIESAFGETDVLDHRSITSYVKDI